MARGKEAQEQTLVATQPFVCFVDGRVVSVGEGEAVSSSDPVAEHGKPYLREPEASS